ncbi:hypothetical protein [Paraburkholderia azotifigens]|uniref:hypothetical protein n=1 Tax=Paraburkholderia azotifigens TaxID=2057004 RepID=UPI0038BA9FB5
MNNFIVSIAEQDSEHYQLLTRIVLRLNNGEAAHQELMAVLFKIRSLLADVQVRMGRGEYDNRVQFAGMEHELQFGTVYAKIILREEWQKLKREVADPEQLIKDIRATSLPDAAAVEELARKIAPSVPRHFLLYQRGPLRLASLSLPRQRQTAPPRSFDVPNTPY